jgi:hypothetical protein
MEQDDSRGDGTTSTVLFIGELMKQSEPCTYEGILLICSRNMSNLLWVCVLINFVVSETSFYYI